MTHVEERAIVWGGAESMIHDPTFVQCPSTLYIPDHASLSCRTIHLMPFNRTTTPSYSESPF